MKWNLIRLIHQLRDKLNYAHLETIQLLFEIFFVIVSNFENIRDDWFEENILYIDGWVLWWYKIMRLLVSDDNVILKQIIVSFARFAYYVREYK